MNNTEKRLEEFDRWFDKVWFDTRESHSCVGRNTLKKLVKSFISESTQQALAEERERVVGMIEGRVLMYSASSNMWFRKGSGALYTNCEEVAENENKAINDLLSSLKDTKSSEKTEEIK